MNGHSFVYRKVIGFRPLELDLHLPARIPAPAILYLHGGGWRAGSRRHVPPALGADFHDSLAARGFTVAAVDYRLSGEATFPAPLDDVRAAITWLRAHPAVDPDQIFLWGESAGAHLALLAALDKGDVQGVVGWFPPTDLLDLPDTAPDSREAQLLGAPPRSRPDLARAASPVTYARADAPPILLMHGDADDLVPSSQSVRLFDALKDVGAPVELDLVEGAGHQWAGAADVSAVVHRSVEFLKELLTR